MLAILKTLFSSKKFLVMLAGIILAVANKLGLDIDPDLVNQILALVGVYIVGQGIADRGRSPSQTPGGGGAGTVLLLLFVAITLSPVFVACAAIKDSSTHAAAGVVDCMKPEAKAMIGELAPTFLDVLKNATGNDGKIDRAPLRAAASSLRSSATRCAFAAAVAEVLRPKQKDPNAPQSAEIEADPVDVRAGFEELRAELYGGARFQLESGTL